MAWLSQKGSDRLLGPQDPLPVEIVNPDSAHALLLVCEHAGQAIPRALGDLGLAPGEIDRHIGWDIGAEAVARGMAQRLACPLLIQRYSRLVIDCNRPPQAPDSIPPISDGTPIPANRDAEQAERAARIAEIFEPFDRALSTYMARKPRLGAFSIHSFTPRMGGVDRPWDIGLLFRKDTATSARLAELLQSVDPELAIGMNQPYQVDSLSDWFVPQHCETRGVAHSLIEIRNDHIATATGQERWAAMLAQVLGRWLKER